MNGLQWVSEWRITDSTESEKTYGWQYRISNGGVYTIANDLADAKRKLMQNIKEEQYRYRQYFTVCVNCNKSMSEHGGRDFEWCLLEYSERPWFKRTNCISCLCNKYQFDKKHKKKVGYGYGSMDML